MWEIPVPVLMGPARRTLVHLLECDDGFLLVDTGWDHPEGRTALEHGVAGTGHGLEDCVGVLVTHAHNDHHGLSGHVRETSGAWIAMHPREAEQVEQGVLGAYDTLESFLLEAGAPTGEVPQMPLAEIRAALPPLAAPDRLLDHDDPVDVPGRRLRTVLTPGHSRGHLCFVDDRTDTLFAGDHLLPRTMPHVACWGSDVDHDPLGDFLDTLDRLRGLAVEQVRPAHEHAFTDLPRRLQEIRDVHEQRSAAVLARLSDGPATIWEATRDSPRSSSWDRIPLMARYMEASEGFALLRHLERMQRIRRLEAGPPVRYAVADGP